MFTILNPTSPSLYVIVGSTATGKTALSIALAKHIHAAFVLSADSQQVYEGLNIGTAKPTLEEQAGILHYGLDMVPPTQLFSTVQFQQYALPLLIEAFSQGQSVVVAGGTGFYLQGLLQPSQLPSVSPNPTFRASLASVDSVLLHAQLREKDPNRANQLEPQDKNRIIRALEIIDATNAPVPTTWQPSLLEQHLPSALQPNIHWIGLQPEDKLAYWAKMEQRVDTMLEQGWLAEVATLVKQYGAKCPALQVAIGYPELLAVLENKQSLTEAIPQINIKVRQYARRQRTWFKRNPSINWLSADCLTTDTEQLMRLFIKKTQ
jgi:tRNA dimethylallyltransferase